MQAIKSDPQYAEDYSEMVDQFRRQLLQSFSDADRITIFRDLPGGYKVNAFAVGTMIALASVIIVCGKPERLDEMFKHLEACWPMARAEAEKILKRVEHA